MYQTFFEKLGITSRTKRSIQDHLSELSMMGFLNSDLENEGLAGGKYMLYETAIDEEPIRTTIEENERFDGLTS